MVDGHRQHPCHRTGERDRPGRGRMHRLSPYSRQVHAPMAPVAPGGGEASDDGSRHRPIERRTSQAQDENENRCPHRTPFPRAARANVSQDTDQSHPFVGSAAASLWVQLVDRGLSRPADASWARY